MGAVVSAVYGNGAPIRLAGDVLICGERYEPGAPVPAEVVEGMLEVDRVRLLDLGSLIEVKS